MKKANLQPAATRGMNIIKISIAVAAIGIIALVFLMRLNSQDVTKIEDLQTGQMERITGMVNSVYISKDSNAFLKVADSTGEISVVAFKSSNIDIVYSLAVGDQVSVLGKVEEYKNALEIIAKEISKV